MITLLSLKATIPALRQKSLLLTGYLEYLIREELAGVIEVFTPSNPTQRGAQLSLAFKSSDGSLVDMDSIVHQLKENNVICDARKPNVMRVAPAPLYNSFQDVHDFIFIIKKVLNVN